MAKFDGLRKIITITQDEQLKSLVDGALTDVNGFSLLERAEAADELMENLQTQRPEFLLLDYHNGVADPLDLIRSISAQIPSVVIISIIPQDRIYEADQVILAGARAFLTQPFSEADLLRTLKRVETLEARTNQRAKVESDFSQLIQTLGTVCVFSPKGGAGCSTVAANLALSLQQTLGEEVLLVDGKLLFGHLDMMLSLRAQYSIADLVDQVDRLDASIIEEVVVEHASGLKVLTSPNSVSNAQAIKPDDLYEIITKVQRVYPYVVIDAGSFLNENVVTYMDASNKIILVINPDITSLRDASQFFDICRSLSYPEEKIMVVVNRMDRRDGLALRDIERSLGRKVFATIPWQRKDSIQSINKGMPVVLHKQNSTMGRAFFQLAENVKQKIGPRSREVTKGPVGNPFQRFKQRIADTFIALRNKDYRYFFFGQILSLVGNWMQIVAQGWLVYELTDSALMLGLVNIVGLLPVVPISLISGVISDRFSRRKLILATELVMSLQAFAFAYLIWTGSITVWHVMVLSFVLGAAAALEQPARMAIIANLVGREDLTNAVALNSAVYNSARIIGPALAGFIVAFWGEASCFFINGVSFAGVIVALLLMKMPENGVPDDELKIGKQMMDGVRFVWNDKTIRALMMIVAYSSFFTLPYVSLMPAFSKDVLNVGSEGLGLLMTGIGVGALTGALRIASIKEGKRGIWLTVGNIMGPVLLIGFTFSRSYLLALLLVVFIGGSNAIRQTLANSLIQLNAKEDFHGRVMSIFNLLFNGMSRVGALVIGGLADITGISAALGLGGVVSLGISLLFVWRLSYVHKIR